MIVSIKKQPLAGPLLSTCTLWKKLSFRLLITPISTNALQVHAKSRHASRTHQSILCATHADSCSANRDEQSCNDSLQSSTEQYVAQLSAEEFNLPSPKDSRINHAKYVSSCVDLKACPAPQWPEFAVIGRSNVGKSSLINMLTGVHGLAQVSKEPGRCRQKRGVLACHALC